MPEINYPEEIYTTRDGGTMTPKQRQSHSGKARRYAYDLGYEHGQQAQGDPLAGWSNLTEAIQAGERIDWERLDVLEAKCVHPKRGALFYKLERNSHFLARTVLGLRLDDAPGYWKDAFFDAWYGDDDWSLYIKGDIPLRARTADQLEPGTCFRARYKKGDSTFTYNRAQVLQVPEGTHVFCFSGQSTHFLAYDPADVEVLEVYGIGTFQTPKGGRMSKQTRIYLDFDGVLNLLDPSGHTEGIVRVGDAVIPAHHARWLADVTRDPAFEIIWATHREEGIYHYTDKLGLPRLPHLTFTDPTGFKVKDILTHYQANPCKHAEVWEDSLTSLETLDLTDAGINVRIYQNTELQELHIAVRRTP